MVKIIVFMKRKPGLSHAAFRKYYEEKHTRFINHLKSCVIDYRRSYPMQTATELADAFHRHETHNSEPEFLYDCVAEAWVRDKEHLEEMYRIMSDPHLAEEIRQDEKEFLDPSSLRVLVCEEEISKL